MPGGWGPQQPQPPAGGSNTGRILLIGGVLAAAAVGVIVLVNGGGSSRGPEAAAAAFAEAFLEGDCDEAAPLATDSYWDAGEDETNVEACESDFELIAEYSDNDDRGVSGVELVSEDDDEAVVSGAIRLINSPEVVEFHLVREDGDWLVDAMPPSSVDADDLDLPEDAGLDEVDPDEFGVEVPEPELDSSSSESLSGDDPEGVTVSFIEAVLDGDCDTAVSLSTDPYWEESVPGSHDSSYEACESVQEDVAYAPELRFTELASEGGTTARVTATFDDEDATETDFLLIREGDAWLVDGFD